MWADNETNEDLLGYQVHADLLKEVVLDSTMLPITIGIFGDWGSGKSSLMLLMKEGIDQWMKEEANKKEKVAQIQFNSWQFENYEDTKLTLIETVLTAIEKDLKKKQGVIKIGNESHIYNPYSVMRAIEDDWYRSYWATTGAYDSVNTSLPISGHATSMSSTMNTLRARAMQTS